MKFINNFISTKQSPTLSDLVKAAQTKVAMSKKEELVKVASTVVEAPVAAEVKVAKEVTKVKVAKEEDKKEDKKEDKEVEVEFNFEKTKKDDDDDDDDDIKEEEKKEDKKEEKKSSSKKWIKIANLTKEQKSFLRKQYEKYWPKNFVDALLSDN